MTIRPAQLIRCVALAGMVLLGGCASERRSSGAWTWTPPARLDASAGTRINPGNAVIQPNRGFRVVQGNEHAWEYNRRDAQLGATTASVYQSWMGWPSEARPTLDRQRTYQTGRSAGQYTYPQYERETRSSRRGSYGVRRRVH